jgi:hypothetical protein
VIEIDMSTKLAAQLEVIQKSIDRLTNQNVSAVHESPTYAIYSGGDNLTINYNWGGSTEGMQNKSIHSTKILDRGTTLTLIPIIPDEEITKTSSRGTTKTTNPKTRIKISIKTDQIRDMGKNNLTKAHHRNQIWRK